MEENSQGKIIEDNDTKNENNSGKAIRKQNVKIVETRNLSSCIQLRMADLNLNEGTNRYVDMGDGIEVQCVPEMENVARGEPRGEVRVRSQGYVYVIVLSNSGR